MKPKILQQGAEAVIYLDKDKVRKKRVRKGYRIKELDEKLRKLRTRSEGKIIDRLNKLIKVPKIIDVDDSKMEIIMEYIDGKKLSESLEELDWRSICKRIGKSIGKIHDFGIIHGDLTTSNMIFVEDSFSSIDNVQEERARTSKQAREGNHLNNTQKEEVGTSKSSRSSVDSKNGLSINKNNNLEVYFIDFGLGFYSEKIEDKAVDLHLLKQALEAKHFKIAEPAIKIILNSYESEKKKDVLEQLKKVESRGRYKERD